MRINHKVFLQQIWINADWAVKSKKVDGKTVHMTAHRLHFAGLLVWHREVLFLIIYYYTDVFIYN